MVSTRSQKTVSKAIGSSDTAITSSQAKTPARSNIKHAVQKFEYDANASSEAEKENKMTAQRTTGTKRKAVTKATQPAKIRKIDSPSKQKKPKRPSSKYAAPEEYAHLAPLTDILESNLVGVFVGFNPGVQTATAGHAYAHPSNSFWKLLHSSGITDRRCRPEEDVDLPRLYSMGNTNLVSRPTRDAAQLSKEERIASVPVLDAKIRKCKPEAVCIVGKSIWEDIWAFKYGKKPSKSEFKYGWQDEQHNMGLLPLPEGTEDDADEDGTWKGARVFATTSTSGLSAGLKPAEKEEIWRPFGEWVRQRRKERQDA